VGTIRRGRTFCTGRVSGSKLIISVALRRSGPHRLAAKDAALSRR
jgi:hypothetical protein